MNIERVTTAEQFEKLYNDSALTWEGLAEDSVEDAKNWIAGFTPFKGDKVTAYITKGREMNEFYGLTGDNAYRDDLTIVSFMLCDMEDPIKLAVPRFEVGGRWFDDIVNNNRMREEER